MREMERAGRVVYNGPREATSDPRRREQPELDAPKRLQYAALPASPQLSGVRASSSYTLRPQFNWCIFSPPQLGADWAIRNLKRIEVARRAQVGCGARVIPHGAIADAHFVRTPD